MKWDILVANAIMMKYLIYTALFFTVFFQDSAAKYPTALVNYTSFERLVEEVRSHRKQRLVDLKTFSELSKEDNVIILDTRSKQFYDRIRIKGAINLPFTEFTQQSLRYTVPDKNTKILIYCNNNIEDEPINFASKVVTQDELFQDVKLTLALNIPTYINLYGYGYRNVFELHEFISVKDQRIEFEGTHVTMQIKR